MLGTNQFTVNANCVGINKMSTTFKDVFEILGIKARVQSALSMQQIAETYARPKAIQYLKEGKIVIFAAGTGNPFFTTDTAAALRGAEMNCDVMLKATNVDGVYTADPKKDPSATRYETITFDEALNKNLKVMESLYQLEDIFVIFLLVVVLVKYLTSTG